MAKAKRMIKRKNKDTLATSQSRHEKVSKKSKRKKVFLIGKILSVIAIILAVFFVVETKIIEEPAKDIKEERSFENLTIKNIDVKYENGNSFFKLELANESDTDFQGRNIKIVFINEDKIEYAQIRYNLTQIKSHETFYINTSTNIDLTKAIDFYIENEQ